ncbi:hypothetical protein [uncultured Veillonella sp.]|uniref:hypothetical protein n=1 Tax=uncultured Veillonella sp. TaxID=159268 RepID=UPI00260FB61E|nr:hypothetical protein [uncultured Veillonella sp.]
MTNVAYYAIHYGVDEKGYIAYNKETHDVEVVLPDETWQQKVWSYLHTEQEIEKATGIDTYDTVRIAPLESLENLKLALTLMWGRTDVQVDWSRPVELDGQLMFPE